jgi:PAS domain S-box-containing protein
MELIDKNADIWQASGALMVIFDHHGYILEFNPACERLTGYLCAELQGKYIWDVLLPEQGRDRVKNLYHRILQGEAPTQHEHCWVTKQQQLYYIAWSTVQLSSDSWLSVGLESQNRIYEARESFLDLLGHTSNLAIQGYNQERDVIFWSQTSEVLYGYTATEAQGKKLENLIIPPWMRNTVVEAVSNWVNQGIPVPAGELNLQRKDGSIVTVFSSHVMIKNYWGEIELYCIDIDLTAQKLAESALQLSESRYTILAEIFPLGLFRTDLAGNVIYRNQKAIALGGLGLVKGKKWWSFLSISDQEILKHYWITLQQSPQDFIEEYALCSYGASPTWLSIHLVPEINPSQQLTGYLGIITDITSQKRNEKILSNLNQNLETMLLQESEQLEDTTKKLLEEIEARKRAEIKLTRLLEEKETLLKEVQHRVKNNLWVVHSLLDLQVQKYNLQPEISESLGKSQSRIYTMALIHEQLSQSQYINRIDFQEYLSSLAYRLYESFNFSSEQFINLRLHISPEHLDIQAAHPCGLIVNELITNALRYAFVDRNLGTIWLSFRQFKNETHQPRGLTKKGSSGIV